MWVEMEPSAQSSFQKLNIDNSCQKHAKLDITFLKSCPILLFLYFVPSILARVVWGNKFLAQSPPHLNFWMFSVSSEHFSNHDPNIKQVICVKSSKFNGFVLALFCILGLGQSLTLENFQHCRLVVFWTN